MKKHVVELTDWEIKVILDCSKATNPSTSDRVALRKFLDAQDSVEAKLIPLVEAQQGPVKLATKKVRH